MARSLTTIAVAAPRVSVRAAVTLEGRILQRAGKVAKMRFGWRPPHLTLADLLEVRRPRRPTPPSNARRASKTEVASRVAEGAEGADRTPRAVDVSSEPPGAPRV